MYTWEATYGFSREYAEYAASHAVAINRGTVSGRVLLEHKIVPVPDCEDAIVVVVGVLKC